MCFAIPYKIVSIKKNDFIVEGGKIVKSDKKLNAIAGDYVRVIGGVAVDVLSNKEGLKIRRLIKSLNN